jgi:hypothetical protein
LEGPAQCWRAERAKEVELEISYQGRPTRARLLWKRLDADQFDDKRSIRFDIAPADKYKTYRFNLAAPPEYRGLITGLAFEPVTEPEAGGQIAIKSIILIESHDKSAVSP